MVTAAEDGSIKIEKLELGPFGTNAYIIVCRKTGDSVLVDTPAEAGTIISGLQGTNPKYILMTHNHGDHLGAFTELRARLRVPVGAHTLDAAGLPSAPDQLLNDGDIISFGNLNLEVMHTPGHTPGSLCFKSGCYLISGDTIFPGGPGATRSPAAFRQIVKSITEKIFPLPDDTTIYPGHGDSSVLEKEKAEFAQFSSRTHDPDLYGQVLWISS